MLFVFSKVVTFSLNKINPPGFTASKLFESFDQIRITIRNHQHLTYFSSMSSFERFIDFLVIRSSSLKLLSLFSLSSNDLKDKEHPVIHNSNNPNNNIFFHTLIPFVANKKAPRELLRLS